MKTLTRARHAQKRIVKAQRRLWILQLSMWPTLVLVGLGAITALAVQVRSRRAGGIAQPVDGLPHL
jgi:hypothetical protein